MIAVNFLKFASLAVAFHASGIESRHYNDRNLRALRYSCGYPPPPPPPNASSGHWMCVGSESNSKPQHKPTAYPELQDEPSSFEDSATEPASETESAEYVLEEPAVEESEEDASEEPVADESEEEVVEEQVVEDSKEETDKEHVAEDNEEEANNTAAALMAEPGDGGSTGPSASAIVGAAAAVAAVAAIALFAFARRRKNNIRDKEWERDAVEIHSDDGAYEDNFVGEANDYRGGDDNSYDDDDVPPPPPLDAYEGDVETSWHQDNYVPDDPSQEGVEISDLIELEIGHVFIGFLLSSLCSKRNNCC